MTTELEQLSDDLNGIADQLFDIKNAIMILIEEIKQWRKSK